MKIPKTIFLRNLEDNLKTSFPQRHPQRQTSKTNSKENDCAKFHGPSANVP